MATRGCGTAASGRPLGDPLRNHGNLHVVSFSPDARWVITAGHDRTVRLWEPPAGHRPFRRLGPVGKAVRAVAFSPDGHDPLCRLRTGPTPRSRERPAARHRVPVRPRRSARRRTARTARPSPRGASMAPRDSGMSRPGTREESRWRICALLGPRRRFQPRWPYPPHGQRQLRLPQPPRRSPVMGRGHRAASLPPEGARPRSHGRRLPSRRQGPSPPRAGMAPSASGRRPRVGPRGRRCGIATGSFRWPSARTADRSSPAPATGRLASGTRRVRSSSPPWNIRSNVTRWPSARTAG